MKETSDRRYDIIYTCISYFNVIIELIQYKHDTDT